MVDSEKAPAATHNSSLSSQSEDETRSSDFLGDFGAYQTLPEISNCKDYYSHLIKGLLNVHWISRGRVTCSFTVKPRVSNFYNGLHGGAVAAIAERVSIASARTIVAEEKQMFLGGLSISYLSAAPINAELIADGSVVRSGRNLTVVYVEFKLKNTEKLVYVANATFFHIPASSKL